MPKEHFIARDPAALPKAELAQIVRLLQARLFLDIDPDGEFWNPDKDFDTVEFSRYMAGVLDANGLIPVPGPKEWRPRRGRR